MLVSTLFYTWKDSLPPPSQVDADRERGRRMESHYYYDVLDGRAPYKQHISLENWEIEKEKHEIISGAINLPPPSPLHRAKKKAREKKKGAELALPGATNNKI